MDLNKEIREIIHKYCGGTFENRQIAASEILKIRDNKQLPIHVVGCRVCGNDYNKLKKNNNSIRYCNKCDKAV